MVQLLDRCNINLTNLRISLPAYEGSHDHTRGETGNIYFLNGQKTANTNKDVEIRVENLERKLSVWKLALEAADDDKEVLRKEVSRLQRNIESFTEDNPLILCLIDGDGNLFAPYLVAEEGINDHMASVDNGGFSGRGQIWLTIYCNKKGLSETLTSNNVCTAEQFDEFFMGFNQAAPLSPSVDVCVGKEAADSKIKGG
ncbi:hypothetical protein BDY19DRAFT_907021 [Irpex rosettiformis]|uniref:Uncharacterized protein n=1 Tax=Irpex rosettiformis TaxID=378272 RepID=A0ACB8U1U5_9APHY|nr:hypothetical protein BDY19DRAFT_907021 [Irpex rosettiformis]